MTVCRRVMPSTHAQKPTASAPEPSAVRAITLKVFQTPQAYWSVMPV